MKYIFIALILISLLLMGCDPTYVLADTLPETVIETVIVTHEVTVQDTAKINELETQLQQYKDLINNLNSLLDNVYYGYASNSNWTIDGFTAFSIKYNDKYYIITAGHAVEDIHGKFYNHKFKANNSNEWIYPELLKYGLGSGTDYAIFYSDKITNGLKIADKPDYNNLFILGHLQTIKTINASGFNPGESGSPLIDIKGNAVGIINMSNGFYTLISSFIDTIK